MAGRRAGPPQETLPRRRIFIRGGGGGGFRRLVAALLLVAVAMPAAQAMVHRVVPVWVTPLQVQRLAEGYGRAHDWVPLADMSPAIIRAVIASEDAQFCAHWGFDFREMRRAFEDWRRDGRMRGASTISMQTARTVFLWSGRDPLRKALEAYLTLWLEAIWPKARILEVYLNTVEWAPGVYGAEAAARHWFGKSAAEVTRDEAARMVAILPAPLRWSAHDPAPNVQRRAATIRARATATPEPGPANAPCPRE